MWQAEGGGASINVMGLNISTGGGGGGAEVDMRALFHY